MKAAMRRLGRVAELMLDDDAVGDGSHLIGLVIDSKNKIIKIYIFVVDELDKPMQHELIKNGYKCLTDCFT